MCEASYQSFPLGAVGTCWDSPESMRERSSVNLHPPCMARIKQWAQIHVWLFWLFFVCLICFVLIFDNIHQCCTLWKSLSVWDTSGKLIPNGSSGNNSYSLLFTEVICLQLSTFFFFILSLCSYCHLATSTRDSEVNTNPCCENHSHKVEPSLPCSGFCGCQTLFLSQGLLLHHKHTMLLTGARYVLGAVNFSPFFATWWSAACLLWQMS